MKRKYLGDSLDHVKRTVIAGCEEAGAAGVHVLPMVTDDPTWPPDDPAWDSYAWLLGLDRKFLRNVGLPFAFVRDRSLKPKEQKARWISVREAYFAAAGGFDGDLFLDPDTGLAFGGVEAAYLKGRPKPKDPAYVHRHELEKLTAGTDRLVVLYQHKHLGDPEGYLDKAKERLGEKGLESFGYWLTHISIMFISRSAARLKPVRSYFERRLAGGKHRIR